MKRISGVLHRIAATAGMAVVAFAFSVGAAASASADTLWSAINPRPAAIDRAAVRVDLSVTTDNKANLGTLGGSFTSSGPGPTHEVNADAKFNALPSLRFDGTAGKLMKLTNFENNSRSLRVFMVHKDVSRSEYKTYLTMNNGGDSSSVMFSVGGAAANNNGEVMRLNMGTTYNVAYGNTALNNPAILDYKISPDSEEPNTKLKAIGALHYATSTTHSSGSTNTIAYSSSFAHNTLWMGERGRGENANFGDFYMGELLIFTGTDADAITDDVAAKIVSYLRAKWLGATAPTVAVSGVVTIPAGETGHIEYATLTCAASTVFDVAEGATLFIDCPIVDGAAPSTFVKRGAGTLVLTRACPNLSGQIVVEAGKLELRGAGALPNAKINGTLTLADGTAATFTAAATPLPAALKKAVVWVDPSVLPSLANETPVIPPNLGTAGGAFTAPNSDYTGPKYVTQKFNSLPGLSFYGEKKRILQLQLTESQNMSRSLRVFMVHHDNGSRANYPGYMGLRNSAYGFNSSEKNDFWICANGDNNEARLIGESYSIGKTSGRFAIMEYNIKPTSGTNISGIGAMHFNDSTTRAALKTKGRETAYNHNTLWLGDRGGDGKYGYFEMGEFLLFFGDGLNGEALTDDEANEVVAYLRKKWLGATALVENDCNPAPTALAVEAGDTATLNGSAAPGLVKTGAGTLKVSGAVSALTVNAGAVEFTGDAPTVDALTLANGAGMVYNSVAGAAGTLTVPADATVTVAVGAAVDRRLEEQTILSFTSGTVAGMFTVSEEAAKRWSVKVVGNEVKLLKNGGMIIVVR